MPRRFTGYGSGEGRCALLQTAVVTAEFALICNSLGTRVRVSLYAFSYVNISLPGRYEISWEDVVRGIVASSSPSPSSSSPSFSPPSNNVNRERRRRRVEDEQTLLPFCLRFIIFARFFPTATFL